MMRSTVRPAFQLRNVSIAVGMFAVCTVVAALVHVLIGAWGRDVKPTSILLALLVFAALAWLVGRRRHRIAESLAALIVVELLFIGAIGWFGYGGLPRPERFFFAWLVPGNLFIALPWLAGTAVGTWIARRTPRRRGRMP